MPRFKIDWISISLPYKMIISQFKKAETPDQLPPLDEDGSYLYAYIMSFSDLTFCGGRAPFKYGYRSPSGGFMFFETDNKDYSLIEFSGKGCEILRKRRVLEIIMPAWSDNITRLDIAGDITEDVDPITFANERDSKRFKSYGIQKSESGTTVYVGSKTSDRYARVYRYNEPHARAGITRVEMVLRDQEAKQATRVIHHEGLRSTAYSIGKIFGWSHPSWLAPSDAEKLASIPRETHRGKTERWLNKQVLPACKKLIEEGNVESLTRFINDVTILLNDYYSKTEM